VTTLYFLLKNGVDVNPVLNAIGISTSTGEVVGTWAAAVVYTGVLYPINLAFGLTVIAPRIAKLLPKMHSASNDESANE